ncbi:MAG TPA: tetratricopeptide repeat protein [Flavobacterium sp.]|nr:tetratricopeptide repeat protein [Flavobacterium sp.]
MCFVTTGFAQNQSVDVLQKYLHELESATSENDLNHLTEQLVQQKSKKEIQALRIIQKALLGGLHARKVDSLNHRSTMLYVEASALVDHIENEALQIWTQTQTGFYYYSYNEYVKATPYFLKSSRLLTTISDADLLDGIEVLKKNAYFFQMAQDYNKSIEYLHRALKQTAPTSQNYAVLLNAIGALYLEQNQLSEAFDFFEKTKQYALQNNDTLRYAKALGDLARIHIKRENWDEAEALLQQDITLSTIKRNDRNTMFARLQLGTLYWKKGDVNKALSILTQVEQYAGSKSYLKGYEKESVELLLEIAIHQKDTAKELGLRRKLDSLRIITRGENNATMKQIALETQKESIVWQLEAEQVKLEKTQLLRWIWTVSSVFLAIAIVLGYILYRRNLKLKYLEFKRKLLAFQYQKIQAEKKLNETSNSLQSYRAYLVEKNRQIRELEQVITGMKNTASQKTAHRANALEQLLSSHLMTDENWLMFKQAFIDEQKEYYDGLLENFPALTESNLRIILLQKVGLNNADTAQTLGITIDAVKKAKQRLRKKYPEDFDTIANG